MTSTPVNFVCLKWGTKYGPEYVNRLFGSIHSNYSSSFNFYCYTDDSKEIRSEVVARDIEDLRKIKNVCFTMEKLFLFGEKFEGPVCLLDLDILLQSDLATYFNEYAFHEPRFSISARVDLDHDYVDMAPFFALYGMCYVNSSFVTWKGEQLKWMIDFYLENKKIIDYKYKDLDTFLFHTLRRSMKFHPRSMVYSYNHEPYRKDVPVVMFNTSHGRGVELHDGPEWAVDLWKSYDAR